MKHHFPIPHVLGGSIHISDALRQLVEAAHVDVPRAKVRLGGPTQADLDQLEAARAKRARKALKRSDP